LKKQILHFIQDDSRLDVILRSTATKNLLYSHCR
jgi:hypothetical protein